MSRDRLRVLQITSIYPSEAYPARGTFVRSQVESLRPLDVESEVLVIDSTRSRLAYFDAVGQIRARLHAGGEEPIDVVHAHYGFCGWAAWLALRVPGAMGRLFRREREAEKELAEDRPPLVVSFLGSDVHGEAWEAFRDGSARRWRAIAAGLGRRAESRLNRRFARRCDAVIVKSRAMWEALGPEDGRIVRIVPNGVDLALFRPLDRDQARSACGLEPLATGGRPIDVLFAADPALPGKRFDLAQKAVAGLGGAARLHAVHGRRQEDLVRWMSAADVLILTSRSEGSPNVVKEALACCLPVVAVSVGDVPDLLARSPENVLVSASLPEGERTEALSEGIRAAARHPRSQARERMRDLSLEAVAMRLRQIYDEVLERRASSRSSPACPGT